MIAEIGRPSDMFVACCETLGSDHHDRSADQIPKQNGFSPVLLIAEAQSCLTVLKLLDESEVEQRTNRLGYHTRAREGVYLGYP